MIWRETERRFSARYSWDSQGQLRSEEKQGETRLYAYDDLGRKAACYTLDNEGGVISREIWQWDENNRLKLRTLKTSNPPAEESWTYEHDDAGRMTAEKRGETVRVEKKDQAGRIVQEYLYNGETPDIITEYAYNNSGHAETVTIKDPDGTIRRQTEFTWDAEGRPASEIIRDSDKRIIKDETYAYGAAHGTRWLERVSWIPDGRINGRRRPEEVIYRSFTFGGNSSGREEVPATIAFANGVYRGPLLGDKPEGMGVFLYNDESRYEGEFHNGVMNGTGRLDWPDGRVMEGHFDEGLLKGEGLCSWADGSRYEGHFKNGLMHGPGRFFWPDGSGFEGLFEDGKRTDQGVWIHLEDQ